MKRRNKIIVWIIAIVVLLFIGISVGGGSYMLHYSLSPGENRLELDSAFQWEFDNYPETRLWFDSLQNQNALHDTTIVMQSGHKCHAYYIRNNSNKTALVLHGWRDLAVKYFFLARIYDKELGYNVVIPEFYSHGQSDGDAIRMGWLDRFDMIRWLEVFQTDTMVVHGVSMGGATTMMLSSEPMPKGIKDIRFIDDCGYTSVWDEFKGELKNQFGLPAFPILHVASILCDLKYGWNFKEASALEQVKRCNHPMLFIHGDNDKFVPTEMVYQLYEVKPDPKELWITKATEHALSYKNHKDEYISRIYEFCKKSF